MEHNNNYWILIAVIYNNVHMYVNIQIQHLHFNPNEEISFYYLTLNITLSVTGVQCTLYTTRCTVYTVHHYMVQCI